MALTRKNENDVMHDTKYDNFSDCLCLALSLHVLAAATILLRVALVSEIISKLNIAALQIGPSRVPIVVTVRRGIPTDIWPRVVILPGVLLERAVADRTKALWRVLRLIAAGEDVVRAAALVWFEQLQIPNHTRHDDGQKAEQLFKASQSQHERQEQEQLQLEHLQYQQQWNEDLL